MRVSTALVLAALSAFLLAGCKNGAKTTGPRKPTTRVKVGKTATPAPTGFEIQPQTKQEREKTAKTVVDGIELARKRVLEDWVQALIDANKTSQDKVRAAQALGELADPMAVPFLLTRLTQEKDPNVRLAAIAALGSIADSASAPALIALLDDEDLDMATAALDALSVMTEADPPYAFVEGTTVKIRKGVRAAWDKKYNEGFFTKKK